MSRKIVIALMTVLLSSACGSPTVTDENLNDVSEAQLRSVAGDWVGLSTGEGQTPFPLAFGSRSGATVS